MITEAQLVELVIDKEGDRYGDKHTRPPIDQPTGAGGITLPVYATYLGRPATIAELKRLDSRAAARPVVTWKIRQDSATLGITRIPFEPLRLQVLDFYYNSGTFAIKWLQRVLRVDPDGVLGPRTIAALERHDLWLVHQAYIAARLQMIDLWTDSDQRRKAWEEGLENRALSFSLLDVA